VSHAVSYDAGMDPSPAADALQSLHAAVAVVRRAGGVVSVSARVAGDVEARCAVAADERHYSASTMKLPILIGAHRRAGRGELDLDRGVVVHDDFDSVVGGTRFRVDRDEDSDPETWAALGDVVPLGVLVQRMITASGNLATNLVLEEVGTPEVAAVLAEAGCSERTTIVRGIEDYAARDAGIDNLVTADDLARLMVALASGRLAAPGASAACERTLQEQAYRDGIPAGLPPEVVVGNKTGWIDGVNHDVALVRADGLPPVGLAVLCSVPGTPEEREAGIARIAAAAWAVVTAPPVGPDPTMTR
jgi:beta-lactamase class A